MIKITWVTRSFLDYRIPIYEEMNRLCDNQLTVIYYADVVPQRCQDKLKVVLGERAIGLTGEIRLSGKKSQPVSQIQRKGVRIPMQPGLIKEIKKSKPDVMLSDGFFQWTYATLWLRLLKKIPHVMCYEGTKHTERNSGQIRTLYRKLSSRFIDHIICNGSLCADYIQNLGYHKGKISLGNMAADTVSLSQNAQKFENEQIKELKERLQLNEKVFLFTGRLVPLKGVDRLINSWLSCFKDNQQASLLIVGDGSEKNTLEKLCTENTCSNIRFIGSIDYDTIHQYFALADIFVIATLQDNWSLVVPEAMSCGLPILCSQYNGCWPELVKPENGWVFDPLDPEGFKKMLKTALESQNKWKEMGHESFKIVQDYSPEKVAGRIFEACIKVAKQTLK